MEKSKTIAVSEKLWKKIMKDKINLGLKTQEEVILGLYKIISNFDKASKLEAKK